MKRAGELIVLPDNPAPHIAEWLFEIGPTVPNGMGEAAIGWPDIDAWCRRTGIDLDPWEARTIRRLSKAFIAQRHDARKPDCLAPYAGVVIDVEAQDAKVTSQFKAMMLAFAK